MEKTDNKSLIIDNVSEIISKSMEESELDEEDLEELLQDIKNKITNETTKKQQQKEIDFNEFNYFYSIVRRKNESCHIRTKGNGLMIVSDYLNSNEGYYDYTVFNKTTLEEVNFILISEDEFFIKLKNLYGLKF